MVCSELQLCRNCKCHEYMYGWYHNKYGFSFCAIGRYKDLVSGLERFEGWPCDVMRSNNLPTCQYYEPITGFFAKLRRRFNEMIRNSYPVFFIPPCPLPEVVERQLKEIEPLGRFQKGQQ